MKPNRFKRNPLIDTWFATIVNSDTDRKELLQMKFYMN